MHAGNSSIRWREGGGPSTLFLFCFSPAVPTLCCKEQHAMLVRQKSWHICAITWHSKQKSEKAFFFCSQLWLICKPTKLPFMHTETLSLLNGVWLLAMTEEYWGAQHGIIGKHQLQGFPKYHFKSYQRGSHRCWLFTMIFKVLSCCLVLLP